MHSTGYKAIPASGSGAGTCSWAAAAPRQGLLHTDKAACLCSSLQLSLSTDVAGTGKGASEVVINFLNGSPATSAGGASVAAVVSGRWQVGPRPDQHQCSCCTSAQCMPVWQWCRGCHWCQQPKEHNAKQHACKRHASSGMRDRLASAT